MKIKIGFCVASVAFACGMTTTSLLRYVPQKMKPAAVAIASSTSCATAASTRVEEAKTEDVSDWWNTPELEDWKNGHNGYQLPLDYGDLLDEEFPAKIAVLPSGRALVAFGDTLYMLDVNRRIVWRYTETQLIFDFAFVETTGLVYGTAGDNTMFILDASTGESLARDSRNGKAGYGVTLPYGKDQCLITDAFGGYREGFTGGTPMNDGVSAWRGTKMLWHVEIPPDSELQVSGSRIFAVTKTKTKILIREIAVPKDNR